MRMVSPLVARSLRSYSRDGATPQLQLVCFPHAGGSASTYRHWGPHLGPEIDLLAVQYPGRQDCISEPCIEDMGELAEEIAAELAASLSRPPALFGHSMGAAVAYEVALRMETVFNTPSRALLVSGREAPHRARLGMLHRGSDEDLLADVRRLGATPAALLENPDLREFLLPSLRADYRLIETYRRERPVALTAPICAFIGDSDPDVEPSDAEAWREVTDANFALHRFSGGHFYFLSDPRPLIGLILTHLGVPAPAPVEWPSTP